MWRGFAVRPGETYTQWFRRVNEGEDPPEVRSGMTDAEIDKMWDRWDRLAGVRR